MAIVIVLILGIVAIIVAVLALNAARIKQVEAPEIVVQPVSKTKPRFRQKFLNQVSVCYYFWRDMTIA